MTLAARRRESTGSMNEVRCFGCGALVLDVDGPTHDYMLAAPGCWALYCSLEDWKSHLAMPGAVAVVQDLVDAYAAQHPAHADRRNRQSVAIHLMSLCLALERGGSGALRRSSLGRWAHREYPQLQPYPSRYEVTVREIADAGRDGDRVTVIKQMTASTWSSWAAHHPAVRGWLDA